MKSISRARNSARLSTKCLTDRAKRSNFHTRTTSNSPLASVMHKRVALGTLALGAAHPLIHKFVAAAKALAGITAEVVELQLATLVDGADTRIQGHCLSLGVHDAILFAGLICFWRSCIDR